MSKQGTVISPIGTAAAAASQRRAERSSAYRELRDSRAAFREVAWLIIKYRMDHGLTQQELADRVGTSHSAISRIESGRHNTSLNTLVRIAHALDLKMLLGFEAQSAEGRPKRELVAV